MFSKVIEYKINRKNNHVFYVLAMNMGTPTLKYDAIYNLIKKRGKNKCKSNEMHSGFIWYQLQNIDEIHER